MATKKKTTTKKKTDDQLAAEAAAGQIAGNPYVGGDQALAEATGTATKPTIPPGNGTPIQGASYTPSVNGSYDPGAAVGGSNSPEAVATLLLGSTWRQELANDTTGNLLNLTGLQSLIGAGPWQNQAGTATPKTAVQVLAWVRTLNSTQVNALQNSLFSAGYYPKDYYSAKGKTFPPGDLLGDAAFESALWDAMRDNAKTGIGTGKPQSFGDLIVARQRATAPVLQKMQDEYAKINAKSGGGINATLKAATGAIAKASNTAADNVARALTIAKAGPTETMPTTLLTLAHPDTIAATAQGVAEKLLGRRLTDAEVQGYVQRITGADQEYLTQQANVDAYNRQLGWDTPGVFDPKTGQTGPNAAAALGATNTMYAGTAVGLAQSALSKGLNEKDGSASSFVGVDTASVAWCQAFVNKVYKQAGVELPNKGSLGTLDTVGKLDAAGMRVQAPVVGGLAYRTRYDKAGKVVGGHVGIVTAVNLQAGTVTTIEGNSGAGSTKVAQHTYPISQWDKGFFAPSRQPGVAAQAASAAASTGNQTPVKTPAGTAAGSRAWRNNNPGNIVYGDFAKGQGAVGQDDKGFAIFPDEATGQKALLGLLSGPGYSGLTLAAAMARWTSGDNSPGARNKAATIAKKLGVSTSTPLSAIDQNALAAAIRDTEGWTPGTVKAAGAAATAPVGVTNTPGRGIAPYPGATTTAAGANVMPITQPADVATTVEADLRKQHPEQVFGQALTGARSVFQRLFGGI